MPNQKNKPFSFNHHMLLTGFIALTSILIISLITNYSLTGQLSMIDLYRTPHVPLYAGDFNPCARVECTSGTATFVGFQTFKLTEIPDPITNQLCKCSDGKIVVTRPYTPKRFL